MSEEKETNDNTPSVQEQVNAVVSAMVQTEEGKWDIPEETLADLPEAIVYAAKAEKRYRDTQGGYTKARQRVKELETVNTELTSHVVKNATMHLTNEEREELDDLKTSDPEAWREKINEHESTAKKLQEEKITEFQTKGKKASEAEVRTTAYQEFTERTGIELNDDVMENQLPASYTKKLSEDKWTFDEFLEAAEKFLTPNVKVKGADDNPDIPKSMNKLPGGKEPSKEAQTGDAVQSYVKETY